MKKKKLDPDCINTIKMECLADLYDKMLGHGRTWGRKNGGDNPYFGTHVTFIGEDSIVILVQERGEKDIQIFQFKRTDKTELGNEILGRLKQHGHSNKIRLR